MKKLDLYSKGKIAGAYMFIASLISFLTLSPWYKVVRYTLEKETVNCTPIEYFSYGNAVPAYRNMLIIFYALLLVTALSGICLYLISHFKKSSMIISFVNVFVFVATTYIALGYFFECDGLNVPCIILSIAGVIVVGIYFVYALCAFIVHRMEVKTEKKIKNMK